MKEVIIYTTTFCPWCLKTKEFLKKINIPFEERNVELNENWAKELFEKSGQWGVPVIVVVNKETGKEKVIIGYDPLGIMEALK